jgi:poly-gamma-glutamate capsule biosynthesis protein CapA/YwtB (metallophosphatase superfamily)
MANFSLAYRAAWLPRLIRPTMAGKRDGFAPAAAELMEPPRETVRLVFVGDISAVANRSAPSVDPGLRKLLGSADLVIGNCESPVVKKPRHTTRFGTRHAMSKEFLADALEAVGIDREALVLSLANNHALDQEAAGFDETIEALDSLGIGVAGASARGPATMVSVGKVTVGFLAATLWRNRPEKEFAGRVSMLRDVAAGGWKQVDRVKADLLCALPHWDWEFRHWPRRETRWMARKFASRGVGLVVGGHAHVVQPIELLGETVVAYSLGDFLGTAWARQTWPGRLGAIFVADISADRASKGQVAAYETVPFMRMQGSGHERLLPLDKLDQPLRGKAEARTRAVLGAIVEPTEPAPPAARPVSASP